MSAQLISEPFIKCGAYLGNLTSFTEFIMNKLPSISRPFSASCTFLAEVWVCCMKHRSMWNGLIVCEMSDFSFPSHLF